MERVNNILHHEKFLKCLKKNKKAEKGRIFCCHNMVHFLDVARIAWILNLEKGLNIDKEWIYAAALLHDIGKYKQYKKGIPHDEASAALAPKILMDCGFSKEETNCIVEAIRRHRDKTAALEENLNGLLYLADKASRPCYSCEVAHLCDWEDDKKIKALNY